MDKLVELAKEKGFETNHGYYFFHDSMPNMVNEIYYLWMCELKLWLLRKYSLDCYTESYSLSTSNFNPKWAAEIKSLKTFDLKYSRAGFKCQVKALEDALTEVLNLIK